MAGGQFKTTAKKRGRFFEVEDEEIANLPNAIYPIAITHSSPRTQTQNQALHLWCDMIAERLNNDGNLREVQIPSHKYIVPNGGDFVRHEAISNYIAQAHRQVTTPEELSEWIEKLFDKYNEMLKKVHDKSYISKKWDMESVKEVVREVNLKLFGQSSTTKIKKEQLNDIIDGVVEYFGCELPDFPTKEGKNAK